MSKQDNPASNFQRYTEGPTYYLRFISVGLSVEQSNSDRIIQIGLLSVGILTIGHQLAYCRLPGDEHSANASFINYFAVGLGKYVSLLYNRRALIKTHGKLGQFYPSAHIEDHYDLGGHLNLYARIQTVLWKFCKYIWLFYNLLPLTLTLYALYVSGQFVPHMPLPFWFPVPLHESVLEMILYYLFQSTGSFFVAVTILSCDLWLFCSLAQLCMHFDLIAKLVMELQPQLGQPSLQRLKEIIRHYQGIVRLVADINSIFTPSIIFSLLSSSFILCFTAYQMLDDVTALDVFKLIFLLIYESKQVIITCYYGNKLMESSSRVFEVAYMHSWHRGSLEYQRLVLLLLTITMKPAVLMIAGIANISLITLQQVFSMAYQTFTVLRRL